MKKSEIQFIPAQESRWFIFFFDLYVRFLFHRRFENVRVDQDYQPSSTSKTIYYLNHTSWWDGLIPLLLNRKIFQQEARAMMEDKQMKKHWVFKKIGAFSVNLDTPRSAVRSLRYAVDSLKRSHSSLFIYPEGQIVPFSTGKPTFKKGLGWLAGQCKDTDIVPIGIYIQTAQFDKPELFLKIGNALEFDTTISPDKLNEFFETQLSDLLTRLQKNAHHNPGQFRKL